MIPFEQEGDRCCCWIQSTTPFLIQVAHHSTRHPPMKGFIRSTTGSSYPRYIKLGLHHLILMHASQFQYYFNKESFFFPEKNKRKLFSSWGERTGHFGQDTAQQNLEFHENEGSSLHRKVTSISSGHFLCQISTSCSLCYWSVNLSGKKKEWNNSL